MILGVARAEVQVVSTFIIGVVCPKMPKAMALEIPIMEVVRLQWDESELTIQGPSCADLIHQLSPAKCSFYLLREGGWRQVGSGSPWGNGNFPKFSEIVIDISDQLRHS